MKIKLNKTGSGRARLKQDHLLRMLRSRIVNGELAPGHRLANRDVLAREFEVSPITLQGAIDTLVRDGFLRARTGQGTFVADVPPHLSTVAMAFCSHPHDPYLQPWSKFWTAQLYAAARLSRVWGRKIEPYFDINGHADSESQQLLLRQVRDQRLAGIIFVTTPFTLEGHPILEEPGLPRVGIMSENAAFPTLNAVRVDAQAWLRRALEHVASRGRKRVALLLANDWNLNALTDFAESVKAKGMTLRPYWIQAVASGQPQWAKQAVHQLLNPSQTEKPDALIVCDDHLSDDAQRGLLAAGVRVGDDIDVVIHANFPIEHSDVLPVARLGYDARELVAQSIGLIDRLRRGETVPPITSIAPIFENELSTEDPVSNSPARPAHTVHASVDG